MPSASLGPLYGVASALTITIAANTPSTDINRYILITNTTSGGTSPYTFTYNAVGLTVSGNTVTTSTPGTYYISENVVDSKSTTASSNLLTLTFNALPTLARCRFPLW